MVLDSWAEVPLLMVLYAVVRIREYEHRRHVNKTAKMNTVPCARFFCTFVSNKVAIGRKGLCRNRRVLTQPCFYKNWR
jgi:hypothetical protein